MSVPPLSEKRLFSQVCRRADPVPVPFPVESLRFMDASLPDSLEVSTGNMRIDTKGTPHGRRAPAPRLRRRTGPHRRRRPSLAAPGSVPLQVIPEGCAVMFSQPQTKPESSQGQNVVLRSADGLRSDDRQSFWEHREGGELGA